MGWIKFPVGFVHNWDILRIMGYDWHKQHNSMWLFSEKRMTQPTPFWMTRNCDLTSKIGGHNIKNSAVGRFFRRDSNVDWPRMKVPMQPQPTLMSNLWQGTKALVREMILPVLLGHWNPVLDPRPRQLEFNWIVPARFNSQRFVAYGFFGKMRVRRWQGKRLMFCSNIWTLFFYVGKISFMGHHLTSLPPKYMDSKILPDNGWERFTLIIMVAGGFF